MGFTLVTRVGMATRDGRLLSILAQGFLRGVVASNRVTLRTAKQLGKPIPPLYSSGVEYDREPWAGLFEEFADITTVLNRGWGDCDDLAAWRVAELLEQGELAADVRLYWRRMPCQSEDCTIVKCARIAHCPLMMHVQVRRGICHADGTILRKVTEPREVRMPNGQNVRARTQCPSCQQFNSGKIEDPSRFLGL